MECLLTTDACMYSIVFFGLFCSLANFSTNKFLLTIISNHYVSLSLDVLSHYLSNAANNICVSYSDYTSNVWLKRGSSASEMEAMYSDLLFYLCTHMQQWYK